ncbi:hypothetical protein SAOR_12975 [Salinisphaera orenii MK-B5]|uniref:Uncharacterized protein n=2 Tax=Salinisphaera orenii TaxID=856731 RepID=A0A423PH34_9GAMM|nr:hypothetical protein SAOR_12975 [Salinisphaera orenii MK-B5]ROO27354.1 hypothetical protein SAHL_11565 [Salinisphaera halophila YIM 95161]
MITACRTDRPEASAGAVTTHQVILVREQDAQHSGSGCCGRLGARDSALGGAADFSHSRARMERIGAVYRDLAAAAPELDLIVADPRNLLWLYPTVWRAARRRGLGWAATIRSMARAGAPMAVVCDGDTLYSGRLPATDTVVARVLERIAQD